MLLLLLLLLLLLSDSNCCQRTQRILSDNLHQTEDPTRHDRGFGLSDRGHRKSSQLDSPCQTEDPPDIEDLGMSDRGHRGYSQTVLVRQKINKT